MQSSQGSPTSVPGVVELRINVGEEVGEYAVSFIDGNPGVAVTSVVVLTVGATLVCPTNDGTIEPNVKDPVLLNVSIVPELTSLLEGENVSVPSLSAEPVVGVVVVDFLGSVTSSVSGTAAISTTPVRSMFCSVPLLSFDVITMASSLGVSCVQTKEEQTAIKENAVKVERLRTMVVTCCRSLHLRKSATFVIKRRLIPLDSSRHRSERRSSISIKHVQFETSGSIYMHILIIRKHTADG